MISNRVGISGLSMPQEESLRKHPPGNLFPMGFLAMLFPVERLH